MTTLTPYSGPWNFNLAAHLLRRTTFGPSKSMMDTAVNDGLALTIDKLFTPITTPPPPVYYDFENDPNAGIGETWINTSLPGTPAINNARRRSLRAWTMGIMESNQLSIFSKMVLFWHEHLAINDVSNPAFGYAHISTLMDNALGNFKTMIQEITIDPQMLRFLNGHQNSRQSPNENYARELLELFTIGRGPDLGSGDYTNYTEQDVQEIARALTGWRSNTLETGEVISTFVENRHDTDPKQLSSRLNNVIINNDGEEEYKTVIDIIFQHTEVARFICRKLHIWFINADITEEVEMNIINPLAQQLVADNYEIENIIKTLLSSEYFFQEGFIGCMISHPLDFLFKVVKTFEYVATQDPIDIYLYWNGLYSLSEAQEMVLLNLPTVAGWKAFYQAPQYYKTWINSVSLRLREDFSDLFVNGLMLGDFNFELDLISFIAQMSEPQDVNKLLDDIVQILFAQSISQNQHDFLKNVLIPGLPDASWAMEYSEFLADPTDPDRLEGINNKLKALFRTLLKMPEFYLT